MSKNAIDDCVKRHNIELEDYEMLIVCTDTPEYLSPSNALKLLGLYEGKLKNVKVAFDLNSNCTGILQGIDVVCKYVKASNIRKALVVGCFCVSPIALWSDTVVYATFADAAACVALCAEEADIPKGLLDTYTYVDADFHEYVTYPKCGMSKVPLQVVPPNEKRLEWNSFSMDFLSQKWADSIIHVLKKNALTLRILIIIFFHN